MLKYQSRKEVQAEPMNELKAVELGYARPNEDNHEWREGFHILYPDGYHSWCPRDVFFKDYRPIESPFDRMLIESSELSGKVCGLKNFLYSETFNALDPGVRELLERQLGAMSAYLDALEKRIAIMTPENCCSKEP